MGWHSDSGSTFKNQSKPKVINVYSWDTFPVDSFNCSVTPEGQMSDDFLAKSDSEPQCLKCMEFNSD